MSKIKTIVSDLQDMADFNGFGDQMSAEANQGFAEHEFKAAMRGLIDANLHLAPDELADHAAEVARQVWDEVFQSSDEPSF